MKSVVAELDGLFGDHGSVTFESLRQIPKLESVLKEVLRLHPPLIILMRKVLQDFTVEDFTIKAGKFVCAAPAITHRIASLFPDPERFDPDRYSTERGEDKNLYAWQAFGGGRHKCSGNAFALFQIKAIFCILLRRYEFELVSPPESYCDDYTKMVVEPASPCSIRYRLREHVQPAPEMEKGEDSGLDAQAEGSRYRIQVDMDLCKGHATCMGEAPELFYVDEAGKLTIVNPSPEEELIGKARAAAKYCPTQAIKIEETE
jgi:sterol 14-demethylase